ncbi:MAG: ADP-glyceromanno-heptose 6-epimerase, partial [Pseudobdellovibrionaceae bacterium]
MIVVTGANGFIGSAIVWQFNQNQVTDIVCVDSVPLNERPQLLQKRQYSHFLAKDELFSFLNSTEAQKVSWIIHMGACSSTTEKNWDFLLENNTQYTEKIFQWCAKNNKNLIYASSAATYGDGSLGFDDSLDSEILRPLNLYGDSKVLFDRWAVKQSMTPKHWYGLKFFNVFGPQEYHKESMSSVAYKAFHQIQKTGQLQLFKSYHPDYKDGEQKRDFIYVKQITSWITQLMQLQPQSGIYNMGNGQACTWLDLAGAVFSAMNLPLKIDWLEMPLDLRNQYQYFTEASMKKWQGQNLPMP